MESLRACNKPDLEKGKKKSAKLEIHLEKAKSGWATMLKDAQLHLDKYDELEATILSIKEKARSTKEKEMKEKVLLEKISKAISDFKTEEMVTELKKVAKN